MPTGFEVRSPGLLLRKVLKCNEQPGLLDGGVPQNGPSRSCGNRVCREQHLPDMLHSIGLHIPFRRGDRETFHVHIVRIALTRRARRSTWACRPFLGSTGQQQPKNR